MKSFFQELVNSLRNNVLRTVLTGSTIAWGILLLVVLVGVGDGMEKGMRQTSQNAGLGDVRSKVELRTTDMPYAGYQKDRDLYLNDAQLQQLRSSQESHYRAMVPYFEKFATVDTSYGETQINCGTLSRVEQGFNQEKLLSGRLFTPEEHELGDRVCLLPHNDVAKLFTAGQDPIGQTVSMWGLTFRVVGTLDYANPWLGVMKIPYQTYVGLFPNNVLKYRKINIYPRTTDPVELTLYESELKDEVRRMLKVHPEDTAVNIESTSDAENSMTKTFRSLDLLLWIMGIGSLAIGTIGVSNIMSVTVEERRREIGIRKSIGAKPKDILFLILGESMLLSLFFGAIGIALGYLSIDVIGKLAERYGWASRLIPMSADSFMEVNVFTDPTVNIGVAIGSLVVLLAAGVLAGYGPARKAIKIPAVIAMREK